MLYRYEVNGEAFGNIMFKNEEDATEHLRDLLERSQSRYERAVKAKHHRTTKALRQVLETYQSLIKIALVTGSTRGMTLMESPQADKRVEAPRYSSRIRNYLDVA